MSQKPLIAIAGLGCETSTFSPARTAKSAFHLLRGPAILEAHPFLQANQPLRNAADWHGILTGHALPGGVVTREAYEALSAEMVEGLQRLLAEHGRIDGFWFEIHGAMSVEGLVDAEADLLLRLRTVIGSAAVVSASMDLHGNVSERLARLCDLITCYRTAPHVDVMETRERAVRNLVDVLLRDRADGGGGGGRRRPFKARVPVPVLLPGEQTSTRMEPAKRLYSAIAPLIDSSPGLIDAAIWVGYAWGDEERSQGVVVATGWDEDAVTGGAENLARLFWDVREEFVFVAPTGTFDECLDVAFTSAANGTRPFFVSDSGDNPTAGGAGDVTWGLTKLLQRDECRDSSTGRRVVYASIPGPAAVAKAVDIGIGGEVEVQAGAEVDTTHAGPVTLKGRVYAIKHGDRHAGTEVVIQVGSVYAIVTARLKPYHLRRDFVDLQLDPDTMDVVVVKIGYLEPELFALAKDWRLALTPGGVDQDLVRLEHRRIQRPMWPFDRTFPEPPDLKARLVGSIEEKDLKILD